MKRLIVNADDLGADEDRNSGIFEAIESGAVTSVSILPNGVAIDDALARLKSLVHKRVSIGLHFNLSEGKPFTPGLRLLIGPDGCFLGKKRARELLLSDPNPELDAELCAEFGAQIARLKDASLQIDHLDGHQHVHCFPAVMKVVAAGARENGIPWIRIADEEPTPAKASALSPLDTEEALAFSGHARSARPYMRGSGLLAPDHFRGLFFKGRLPALNWVEFLKGLPPGLTELMVHPGRASSSARGPFSAFSTSDREIELEALASGRFLQAIAETGVKLTPFPEVPKS